MSRIKNIFIFIFTVTTIICCIYIPGHLLNKKYQGITDTPEVVPKNYYIAAETAMAKTTSRLLSSTEKVKLITGVWEGTSKEVDIHESSLSEIDAVEMAKENIDFYEEIGLYPDKLSSDFNNWYTYETKLYSYSENVFNTYTTYLWVITFMHFSTSKTHTIYMTEDGTILYARADFCDFTPSDPKTILQNNRMRNNLFLENVSDFDFIENATYANFKKTLKHLYPDQYHEQMDDIHTVLLSLFVDYTSHELYLFYTYRTGNSYVMGLMPEDIISNYDD